MEDFFSKYGWLVVVGVIIIIAIAMASPVGDAIKSQITNFVSNFAGKVNSYAPGTMLFRL